jgi:hypothetical protein
MKNILWNAVAIAALISSPATAEDRLKICEQFSEGVGEIMKARQRNVPMADVVNVFKRDPSIVKIIILAYEKPRFHSEKQQQNAVEDFRNNAYLTCLKDTD